MLARLRLLLSVAALAFGLAVPATAQTQLPAGSPFLPGGNQSVPAAAPGGLEFVAVLTEGKTTSVNLYDPTTKKTRWIPVRGEVDGIAVLSCDAPHNQVVVRTGGAEKRLTLRHERSTVSAPAVASPASAQIASATAPATATLSPAGKPPGPTAPPSVSKEQEEARMLVSDLLEIGLAQRKAHEELQKKAAAATAPPAKPSGG